MRAVLVSVDYTDILSISLPYNRHHFTDVLIVTSHADAPNLRQLTEQQQCKLFATDAFYRGGATFNKWVALEEGLDHFGREGLLCLMDADILWPKQIPPINLQVGQLLTPLRHIMHDPPRPFTVPPESEWRRYQTHKNEAEWAGYSQIFHASDPVLGNPPWHETNWNNAGGADSFFQMKWHPKNKLRPSWTVLHIGTPGVNWFGRSTPYLDGTSHPQAKQRRQQAYSIWQVRRDRRMAGLDPYEEEKIGG